MPKTITLQEGQLSVDIRETKSDCPGYERVEVTFPDIYQSELHAANGWSEDALGDFDRHIFGSLQGLEAVVDWEDREFFVVDIPQGKTVEPAQSVYDGLKKLLTQDPLSSEEIKNLGEGWDEAKARASDARMEELKKIRVETSLFRGYKRVPRSENPLGHEGYCIVEMTDVKRVKGLTYDQESFVREEHRRTATKPNMVFVRVSTSGRPFDDFYGGTRLDHQRPYDSKVLEVIKGLGDDKDIVKSEPRISTTTGDSEEVLLLCTRGFAQKVGTYFSERFSSLDQS